jgi:hypothetical protein
LILSLSLGGCSHYQKPFQQRLDENECDEALMLVPEEQSVYKVAAMSQQAGGTLISYSFTGAAYTVQILWDVTVGVTTAIVLCAPGIVLEHSSSVKPAPRSEPTCFPADIKPLLAPRLGQQALKSSSEWRCPDLSGLTHSLQKVASCYAQRGTEEGRHKAINVLETLTNSGSFYSCLSAEDTEAVGRDLARYRERAAH